ncbi:nucleopolyhedrovirus P10 family protein [Streptomyces malaysiensis]|uniref:Nucleopolyhedrovirus P10 family protein n=1 Tax=Streptomyces malaysiensis subsp. samsunensis TaxID=459658 RepID=A0A9X2LX97_STRMQ|nr:nucleopolyhedrovirus P10 family protein [Streptomyces samsunensis]MCQ8831498.1 nucleopolyhedrovirus P10 family protein [Streptomyces samsunensis]
MVTDRLAQTVREQLRLGRLLPLGEREDGSWITERAAAEVLGRAAAEVPDAHRGSLRIAPADPDAVEAPAVPPPPSALPPGPLRIAAECGATLAEPLPVTADRLRDVLLDAATDRLGLLVEAVDIRVTEVLEELPALRHHQPPPRPRPQSPPPAAGSPDPDSAAAAVARAIASVPGVARLAPVLGSPRAVRIEGAHIRVELAVAAGHRAVDVARAVRTAVARSAPVLAPGDQPPTVAVLVTAVEP